MKRMKLTALIKDETDMDFFKTTIIAIGGEFEHYEERQIPKEADALADHSMEALLDALKDFANGIWLCIKSFTMMAKWSIIMTVTGLRWLWKRGAGQEKKKP